MKDRARRCLVWTLLLLVCVHGTAAVLSAVRGPAHVHAGSSSAEIADTAQDPRQAGHFESVVALAARYAPATEFPPRRHQDAHHHDEAQRHYHLPGGDVVLVHDGGQGDIGMLAERTSRSESASPGFIALIASLFALAAIHAGAGFGLRPVKELASRALDRIERPPRLRSA